MTANASKPTIPAGEYPQRWSRVQALMAQQELDLLVAYADDRAVFGPAHARWLANFPVHFEPACVLMPRQGEPVRSRPACCPRKPRQQARCPQTWHAMEIGRASGRERVST